MKRPARELSRSALNAALGIGLGALVLAGAFFLALVGIVVANILFARPS